MHRAQLAVFDHADLTGFHITDELRTQCIERTSLGSENIAAVQQADAQRAEPVRVTRRDQLAWAHHDERIRTLNDAHGVLDSFFDAAALEAFVDDSVNQHLGVV